MKPLLIFFALGIMPAFAETKPISEMGIAQVVAPLFFVVLLIFLLAWLVKKINPNQPSIGKDIMVLSSTPVSNQARLCLVRVGNKDILVGVTSQQVNHIETFNEPVIEQPQGSVTSDLSKQFKRLLKREESEDNKVNNS